MASILLVATAFVLVAQQHCPPPPRRPRPVPVSLPSPPPPEMGTLPTNGSAPAPINTSRGRGQGPLPARSGAPATTPPRVTTPGAEGTRWQDWWELNHDEFVNVRDRYDDLRAAFVRTQYRPGKHPRRPSSDEVRGRIHPALSSLVEGSSEVGAAAIFNLARCSDAASDRATFETVKGYFRRAKRDHHGEGVLALGFLENEDARQVLTAIALDQTVGRKFLRQPAIAVSKEVRSYAALALGYSAEPTAVETLIAILNGKKDPGAELASACFASLGMRIDDPHHRLRITQFLIAALHERQWPDKVLAHIPIALARSHDPGAVAALWMVFEQKHVAPEILRSCVLSLGRLGSPLEPHTTDLMLEVAQQHADSATRRLAWLALGELAMRATHSDKALSAPEYETLKKIADAQRRGFTSDHPDAPWMALSAGMLSSAHPAEGQVSMDLLTARLLQIAPETRCAAALALGLSSSLQALDPLRTLAQQSMDESVQGYAAEALGMLRDGQHKSDLLNLCLSSESSPVRTQAARALGYLAEPMTVQPMVLALRQNDSPQVQKELLRALGETGDRSSIDALIAIVTDEDQDAGLRVRALAALGRIGQPSNRPWNWPYRQGHHLTVTTYTLGRVQSML